MSFRRSRLVMRARAVFNGGITIDILADFDNALHCLYLNLPDSWDSWSLFVSQVCDANCMNDTRSISPCKFPYISCTPNRLLNDCPLATKAQNVPDLPLNCYASPTEVSLVIMPQICKIKFSAKGNFQLRVYDIIRYDLGFRIKTLAFCPNPFMLYLFKIIPRIGAPALHSI